MATILDFRPSTLDQIRQMIPDADKAAGTSAGAELIFFPGVRYERATPDPEIEAARRKRKQRSRARDEFDLPD